MKLKIFLLFIIAVLSFTGCENKEDDVLMSPVGGNVKQPRNADFKFSTYANGDLNIHIGDNDIVLKEEAYKNKVILLNFFATWCPPCRAEIPHLINLRNKYGSDFEIIGIMLDDGLSEADKRNFISTYQINYTVSLSQEQNQALATLIGNVRTIPYMMLFAKDGKFVLDYKGAVPEEMIESDIKKLIGTK